MRKGATHRGGWWVAALCVASLLDLGPVRSGEQFLASLLLPLEGVVRRALPEVEVVDAPQQASDQAWASWWSEVARRPLPLDPSQGLLVVPVESRDARRLELRLSVPGDVTLRAGSVVTHRGILVGVLLPWSDAQPEVVYQGHARVALLGHEDSPAVAASWRTDDGVGDVSFLLTPGPEGLHISHLAGAVDPRRPSVAVTRDVSALGVDVPPDLMLGTIAPRPDDAPGGGLRSGSRWADTIAPLVDADELALVAVEAPLGHSLPLVVSSGRLVPAVGGDDAVMIDCGTLHGLLPGDAVVQDGRWVGRVGKVGPTTAEVLRAPPVGALLVEVEDGLLEPLAVDAAADSSGRRPAIGRAVFSGHPALGGFYVGRIAAAGHGGFTVELPTCDPLSPVQFAGR